MARRRRRLHEGGVWARQGRGRARQRKTACELRTPPRSRTGQRRTRSGIRSVPEFVRRDTLRRGRFAST
ncbi:hypothetical protein AKJ09_04354 [Labilithrix luteola]|uniref:Uncharacterized protein n=1 Tax=Labilithrix luteola TaxID=1391654 RepID=A0A0K1PVY3_9BACT|nr:hypothetical protein AKJ09_04354 [Labilithrix luteola]